MANSADDTAVGLLNLMKQKISNEDADHTKVAENLNKKKDNCTERNESLRPPSEGSEEVNLKSKVIEFSEGQKSKLDHLENSSDHVKLEAELAKEDETDALVTSFGEFFREEWKAFKTERATSWSEKKTREVALDFEGLRQEWKYGLEKEEHWVNQAKKQKESDTCTPLFYSILIGIIFVVIPNGAILLDMLAASDYLGGQWYLKRWHEASTNLSCIDPLKTPVGEQCCRKTEQSSWMGEDVECFEKDPLWGALTLLFLFIPGVFWSLGIFIQFASYLRKKNPEKFDQKRVLFFFFLPAAALCTISFPLQLMIVSVIATFNTQDHWTILTSKIGIAEGFFNAHFQYLLQLFVFFLKADRHPSAFQYASAFGSLLFLMWTRIESLLADRGGHRLSPGQKIWWLLRFGPVFLFNSAFKLGSISLIFAILRYNAIWIYLCYAVLWLGIQFFFNQQYLPRKFYYLFVGAGMHACSVAHIQETVKLVWTGLDSTENILWISRLTDAQLKMNMWCQNLIWFTFNCVTIVTLWIISDKYTNTELSILWPFFQKSFSFEEVKVVGVLHIVVPLIITLGVVSLLLLLTMDFKTVSTKDSLTSWMENYPCWTHSPHCKGCRNMSGWHMFESNNCSKQGLIGCLSRTTFPLINIWQNAMDKNVI